MNFLEIIFILLLRKNFDMGKSTRDLLENLFEYYILSIIVNVNFFSDLKLEYVCEYCYKWALNKKLALMGGAVKYYLKKIMGHEIFRSMVSWATIFFLKKL